MKINLESISAEQFRAFTRPLIGLLVSRSWRGYGSAVILELGKLTQKYPRSGHSKGEAGVMIDWSWRVETPRAIAFGSFSGKTKINNGVRQLTKLRIADIQLEDRLPELSIEFAGGRWLRSFMTAEGQPEWCIFLQDGSWLQVKNGTLKRGWTNKVAHRTG